MTKRARVRMMKYKTRETSGDVDYAYEAFAKPAVKIPAISQPGDADSIESPASPPPSSQPEGCPLTQPEDDSSDSSESESTPTSLPTLYVLPDATVITTPYDTVAVFKPFNPNEDMTQDVCDVIIEEVIARKVILECRNSPLTIETATYNVCQDVASTIISTDWQKEVRRRLQSHLK